MGNLCRIGTVAAAIGTLVVPALGQATVVELKFRPIKAFNHVLPAEVWSPANAIAIRHAGGESFASEATETSLRVDTDGDGAVDQKVQGTTGYAVLKGEREGGEAFQYAVRFRNTGSAFEYSCSGAMSGSLAGTSIELIDGDNDGVWNEYGVDAMVVGGGVAASWLSRVVNIKGDLWEIDVDADGKRLRAQPFTGETGTLELRSGLALSGKLVSAVVSDSTRQYSFEVGNTSKLTVPAASYVFSGGFATSGSDTARLRAGKMTPLDVEAGKSASMQWGAPLVAEFGFQRQGETVTVQPNVKFLGRGGEEWHTLLPDAKSPKLEFYDGSSNKLLASKRFGGC
ncbi:MAG: hypothetical protein HZB39_20920 [Planctomycetes bacterium]|nr:hypothetical protein [Planctomycetota bacterium]